MNEFAFHKSKAGVLYFRPMIKTAIISGVLGNKKLKKGNHRGTLLMNIKLVVQASQGNVTDEHLT